MELISPSFKTTRGSELDCKIKAMVLRISLACSMEIYSYSKIFTSWLAGWRITREASASTKLGFVSGWRRWGIRLARSCARRPRALGESWWLGSSPMKMTWMSLLVLSWQRRVKNHDKMREREREGKKKERKSCRSLIQEQVEEEERDTSAFSWSLLREQWPRHDNEERKEIRSLCVSERRRLVWEKAAWDTSFQSHGSTTTVFKNPSL